MSDNLIPPGLLAYINSLIRQKRRLLSLEFDVRTSTSDDEIRQYVFRAFTSGSISKEEHDEMISFLLEQIEEKIVEANEIPISIVEKEEIVEETISEKPEEVEQAEEYIEPIPEFVPEAIKEPEIVEEVEEVVEIVPEKPREPYFLIDISTLKRKERILLDIIDKKRDAIKKRASAKRFAEEKLQSKIVPEPEVEIVEQAKPEIAVEMVVENPIEPVLPIEISVPTPTVVVVESVPEPVVEQTETKVIDEEIVEFPFEDTTIYIKRETNPDLPDIVIVHLGDKEIARGPLGHKKSKVLLDQKYKAGFLFEPTREERAFKAVYNFIDEITKKP